MLVLSPDVSPSPCVTNMRFTHTHTHMQPFKIRCIFVKVLFFETKPVDGNVVHPAWHRKVIFHWTKKWKDWQIVAHLNLHLSIKKEKCIQTFLQFILRTWVSSIYKTQVLFEMHSFSFLEDLEKSVQDCLLLADFCSCVWNLKAFVWES